MSTAMMRSRWAAFGAAVAMTLGGVGASLVGAEIGSGDKPVTVLLDAPCRLLETRPSQQGDLAVPSRATPLGPGEVHTVSATAAPLGNCDLTAATLGTTVVGLVTNVTPVAPTQATDLRLYPTGAAVPETSNLNPTPGEPPTPNAVTVGVSASGRFDILNKFGQVHLIVDVIGYLADHNHDDRYYTETEIDTQLAGKADAGDACTLTTVPGAETAEIGCGGATVLVPVVLDADGDGYADQPIDMPADCNSSDPDINPGATEVGDGVDNNCNGQIDEGFFIDNDSDGFPTTTDCNDGDESINPGATEVLDGVDNDCDGTVDEGFIDDDNDLFAPPADCDDSNADVHPGAAETLDNRDNDCDGGVDEGLTTERTDADVDGYTPLDGDSVDDDAEVYPTATEVADGKDNDLDGLTDEIESGTLCNDGIDNDADGLVDGDDPDCTIDRTDTDTDGQFDFEDDDDDGDGVLDGDDPMPLVAGNGHEAP